MSKQTKKITSIGGSALIEGIMMRGPKKSTVCVRTGKDTIYSEDISINTIPSKVPLFKIPFLRGIAGLIDSMRLSYKSLMLSADKAIESAEIEEEPSKFEKWLDEKFGDKLVKVLMVIASVFGVAIAIGLFFFLPCRPSSLTSAATLFRRSAKMPTEPTWKWCACGSPSLKACSRSPCFWAISSLFRR